ncbi:MAG: hypothetical protein HC847_27025 [Hydrococcus sp. RU_2_2]|nr:hypothetical protein [Hydrococcus sp. RU_2_2]NJP22038.1 hypothetical protein [Hydrococcus sp. CRU_1_1]
MKKNATFLALTALFSIASLPSYGSDFSSLVSGQQVPLAKQLKDLDSSWRQISVSGQFEMGDFMKNWSGLFGGSPANYVYYTQGETVEVASETYVIAYRIPSTGEGLTIKTFMETTFSFGCNEASLPIQLAPETTINLSLLNLRTIGSLNDVRSFNLSEELAASQKRYEEAKKACEQMPTDPTTMPTETNPLESEPTPNQ